MPVGMKQKAGRCRAKGSGCGPFCLAADLSSCSALWASNPPSLVPSLGADSSIRFTALLGRKNVALHIRLLEPCLLAHDIHLAHVSCPLTHRRPSRETLECPSRKSPCTERPVSATPELSHRIERDPSGARTRGLRKGVGAGFIYFCIKAQSPCTHDQAKGSLNSGRGVHPTLELGVPEFQGLHVQE